MMNRIFAALILVIGISACSKEQKGFSVSVDAPAIGTQQITVYRTTADGNRTISSMPAVNGEFSFSGSAGDPALVEIYTSNRQLLAALIVQNGENISLTVSDSGTSVSGSDRSKQLLAYKPGDDIDKISDPTVRHAVRVVYAQAEPADSISFPAAELIMGKDSVRTFEPEGVWVFTSSVNERTSSLIDTLRAYANGTRPLRDVFVSGDTAVWRMSTRRDSATWTQAMMPDAPLVFHDILRHIPSLIEVDSTGMIVRNQRLE